MRWICAALVALYAVALPLKGLGKPGAPTAGLTILYSVDERGEISPCG
ncbi:MAG: hypothetical protein IH608_03855 [Proteobacteria bacterium]|nr:hypothetical protein [Pseudomonadota bacterium]